MSIQDKLPKSIRLVQLNPMSTIRRIFVSWDDVKKTTKETHVQWFTLNDWKLSEYVSLFYECKIHLPQSVHKEILNIKQSDLLTTEQLMNRLKQIKEVNHCQCNKCLSLTLKLSNNNVRSKQAL